MGKLLFACLPEEDQRKLLSETNLTKRGPNMISSKRALRSELDEVKVAGFAVNDEETRAQTRLDRRRPSATRLVRSSPPSTLWDTPR
jgi:DNA-binding IclR family transcriptional regulator